MRQQFCIVKRCTLADAERAFAEAMIVFHARSKKTWTVAVTPALLARFPALKVPHGRMATKG